MFSRTIRIFFAALFVFCVVPMAAFAQDDGSPPANQPTSVEQMIPFNVSDVRQNNPTAIQSLREAGLSDAEINDIRSNVAASSASIGEYTQAQSDMTRWFLRQCDVGRRSWIVFDIGPGGLGTLTTYQQFSNLTTIVVDKEENACPVDAICGFISWVQRPGLAPYLWGIRYNGPVAARYSWCSR
ncbi:MAG: hypothetical protein OXI77_02625 [Chloroflexota bacterium]|nr:hypothetical protein [Chloroflexota bacterium]MDE2908879.1 hypothetical protein [Chloroflexota bacterium]